MVATLVSVWIDVLGNLSIYCENQSLVNFMFCLIVYSFKFFYSITSLNSDSPVISDFQAKVYEWSSDMLMR